MKRVKKVLHCVHNHTSCMIPNKDIDVDEKPVSVKSQIKKMNQIQIHLV